MSQSGWDNIPMPTGGLNLPTQASWWITETYLPDCPTDLLMLREALKLAGLPHEPIDTMKKAEGFAKAHRNMAGQVTDQLNRLNLSRTQADAEYDRMMFHIKQHQINHGLIQPLLELHNGQWAKLKEMSRWHQPMSPLVVVDGKVVNDVILKATVVAGRKELGLPTDEESVEKMWVQMSQAAEMMALQMRISRFTEWHETREYPDDMDQMLRLFQTDLLNAANQVIHDYLTEPIAARQEEIERERERLEALL